MSQMNCMESSIVLTPEDICSREEWIAQGAILIKGLGTLVRQRVQVSRGVRETCCHLDRNELEYSRGRGQGCNPLGNPLFDVGECVSNLLWV